MAEIPLEISKVTKWIHHASLHGAFFKRFFSVAQSHLAPRNPMGRIAIEGLSCFWAALFSHYGWGALTPDAVRFSKGKILGSFGIHDHDLLSLVARVWDEWLEEQVILGALKTIPDPAEAADHLYRELCIRVLVSEPKESEDLGLDFWDEGLISPLVAYASRLIVCDLDSGSDDLPQWGGQMDNGDGMCAPVEWETVLNHLADTLKSQWDSMKAKPLLLLSHRVRCALAHSGCLLPLQNAKATPYTHAHVESSMQHLVLVATLLWPFTDSKNTVYIQTPISAKSLVRKIKADVKGKHSFYAQILSLLPGAERVFLQEPDTLSALSVAVRAKLVYETGQGSEKLFGLTRWGLKVMAPFWGTGLDRSEKKAPPSQEIPGRQGHTQTHAP